MTAADLSALPTDELLARREEIAEQLNPLWLRLDQLDDEIMHRRREERRSRLLAGPAHDFDPAADAAEGA